MVKNDQVSLKNGKNKINARNAVKDIKIINVSIALIFLPALPYTRIKSMRS